jgi:hypothetical protein
MPDELRQQPKEGSPRELPKLAVGRAEAATGPSTTGTLRTTTGSHSHHLSSSAALPRQAPQLTVTGRFAPDTEEAMRLDFEV